MRRLLQYTGLAVLLLLAPTSAASAQEPAPAAPLNAPVADSASTEVLVLGTPHLSGVADQFAPQVVDSLLTRLDAFGPDAIAVEKMSGRQAATLERWSGPHDRVADRFAGTFLYHGHQIRKQTGASWSQANQHADSLLAIAHSDSTVLSADARRTLVQHLVAAYRFPSAALQWRHLAPADRVSSPTLPDTTVTILNSALTAANEVYSIGLRLAHRRGHQRLYPIDDHTGKDRLLDIYRPLTQAIGDSMRTVLSQHPVLSRIDSLKQAGLETGSLLPMYRALNTEAVARADAHTQWRTMLYLNHPDALGRIRLALWEARNLRMVSHIRRATTHHPGGRVLVIVGSSHKPFLDAYLEKMMGVEVVDAAAVLSGS